MKRSIAILGFLFTVLTIMTGLDSVPAQSSPLLWFSDKNQLSLPCADFEGKYSAIVLLNVHEGAESDLFEKPKIFSSLEMVGLLSCPSNVDHYLDGLSSNYSNITELSITQKVALETSSLEHIKKFRKLRSFSLRFLPDKNVQGLFDSLPKSIENLFICESSVTQNPNLTLTLPKLKSLDIRVVTLSDKFLDNCNFPELKSILLIGSEIEEGSFESTENFPNLRKVTAVRTIIPLRDINSLKKRGVTVIQNHKKM